MMTLSSSRRGWLMHIRGERRWQANLGRLDGSMGGPGGGRRWFGVGGWKGVKVAGVGRAERAVGEQGGELGGVIDWLGLAACWAEEEDEELEGAGEEDKIASRVIL
jgi:hypothetical protein